ncbi:DEgenerin Linked to Mechanosensation, partial [Trichostrongylus colubriformis]
PPSRSSILDSSDGLRKRASQVFLEIPAAQLKKIKETEGIGSVEWETKHFCEITTLHGPKRVFYGKRFSCVFWLTVVSVSFLLLLLQISSLVGMYLKHPIVSQVSFLIKEHGIEFPVVTLCNFNPVKKSYIKEINKTGDFSDDLLEYLMEFLQDASQKALDAYQATHPDFRVRDFFMEAGFACEEQMKLCAFGGRQFNCCRYTSAILTNMGKCHRLDLQSSGKEWMMKQVEAGVTSGLQMILDAHLEEQFDESAGDPEPIFTEAFENGFRYYVHPPETLPYLTSEGISVSPTAHVYSALSTSSVMPLFFLAVHTPFNYCLQYILLPRELWGNCTSTWPREFNSSLPYSAVNCNSICIADYFYSNCGCSPFTYDIDNEYPMCSPFHTVRCIDDHIRKTVNGVDYYAIPKCEQCQIECKSIVYHAYNSYGLGFSNGALTWLNKKNKSWSKAHMKANFLTINVFFRDMSYTEYAQKQGTTLTEILSDIGGNMGMFLGMSVVTLVEIFLYCSKVGWITFSKKRRGYMYRKKAQQKVIFSQLVLRYDFSSLPLPEKQQRV